MADPMVIEKEDVDLGVKKSEKKSMKRKREDEIVGLIEEKELKIKEFMDEVESLFRFYYVSQVKKKGVFCVEDLLENGGVSLDLAIAVLIEESSLPLVKLVEVVFERLKCKFGNDENGGGITIASVKSKVILIGQRLYYGLSNADADVLEDDAVSALWCWETRDLKVMPKSARNLLKIRRTCRKKIYERINALSSMIDVLRKSQIHEHSRPDLVKAMEKLRKTLNKENIQQLVESMAQKNNNEMADKEAKCGERLSIKQSEKNKREAEKERKRVNQELQKEKLRSEKELKRLQDEAEKEARRREKEESEKRKQLKRQQEELEKEHQRKEREKTELKMKMSLQKQASLMERFLKKAKPASTSLGEQSLQEETPTTNKDDKMHASVTQSMDNILLSNDQVDSENLWRCHLKSWRPLRGSGKLHWSSRQKPKKKLIKKLKLSTNVETCHDEQLNIERVGDGSVDPSTQSTIFHSNMEVSPSSQKHKRHKQLLQFDKANRPAFYGFWPKKSQVVKARQPFVKDPDIDYEIDSDEEWEEEEPGESLSDCDKDDESENLEEGCSRDEDEEENEDGFFVPDGYLSEDEGVDVEKMDGSELAEGRNSPTSSDALGFEDLALLLRQQKHLRNMTDHSLRKNQPLVILNLSHEKASLLLAEDLTGADKIEKLCLQALSMCAFPDSAPIEISVCNDVVEGNQEACSTQCNNTLPVATEAVISDSDVPQIIAVVQSNSQGINKIIEALHHKFLNTSKSQLRYKVREIADFCDNRWQVKKDVLVKFGLPTSPETVRGKNRSISTFFSKRCQLPGKHFNPNEASPQSAKLRAISQRQLHNTSYDPI